MWKKIFISMLVFIILVGCGTQNDITQSMSTNVPTQIPDFKMTPQPLPTLSFDLQEQFYALLQSNNNCELPCFLGIQPSISTLSEAESIFGKFLQSNSFTYDYVASTELVKVYFGEVETNKDISLSVSIKLWSEEENITGIIIKTDASRNGYLAPDDQHLFRYSLHEVFLRHGMPDSIYLLPPKYSSYGLQVVYEKLKLAMDLTGAAKRVQNGNYEICPNLGDGDIILMKIALASPVDLIDVKTLIGYPFWEGVSPFEEVAGMSIGEFYELIISDNQPACFEIQ